jgi:hypothetical protein
MKVGAGAWATTHFNPDLKVEILGLSLEQEKSLTTRANVRSREVIGTWLDERPFLGSRITLFRENGVLFMESTYPDGSSGKEEMVEGTLRTRRTFRRTGPSLAGDFYLIDDEGNLQLHDNEGHIATARRLR